MPVRYSKKWVNPLYWIIQDILKDNSIRTVFVMGGKSSAKTQTICQALSAQGRKGYSSLGFRKESSTIPTTLKESFVKALHTMRLYPVAEVQDRKIVFDSGANITLKGIDDEEKAKGVEGYQYVLIDELNQFLEGEYDAFEMSLRGVTGQKIFATWNPINQYSWVKVNLTDKIKWVDTDWKLPCPNSFVKRSEDGLFVLIKTTYEDNYWITGSPCGTYGFRDNNLIAKYNAMKTRNYNRYKVEVLGEYGKVDFGGEFLKSWRPEDHSGLHPYDPQQAIYLSFDENVNPYFPCGFFQPGRAGKSPRMIYAIAAKHPNNTVKWMCKEIARKLLQWGHKESIYVGGDSTSQKEDVKQEKGHDLFRLIIKELELSGFRPIRRVSTSNPSVRMSADFFNALLSGDIDGMSFAADENNCREAIIDFENTKEDKNGGVDKTTIKDPITKVSYQPYGHFVDLTRYFLVSTYKEEYEKYSKGDDTGQRTPIRRSNNQPNRY